MRAAPAVSAPLDGCRPERVLIALLYGATGAALAGWGVAHHSAPGSGPLWLLLGMSLGMSLGVWVGLGLARRLLPGDVAQLAWDGAAWSVQGPAASAAAAPLALTDLQMLFDLGPWVLLRAGDGSGRPRWLVLRQRRVGPVWHLLRVALMAHAVPAKGRA